MKHKVENRFLIALPAVSENERLARQLIAAFIAPLDPTLEELADLRTAVSEAVTNCIIHAYHDESKQFYISAKRVDRTVTVKVRDKGCGIADIEKAREPLFTTGGEERSGLGFSVMESLTDRMRVVSHRGRGTAVTLEKYIAGRQSQHKER